MKTFEKIYSENYSDTLNYINWRINNSEIAEELTNDVFVKVHKHLANFDESQSTFSTWLRNITNNTVIDHFKTNHYGRNFTMSSDFSNDNGIDEFQFVADAEADSEMNREELSAKIMKSFRGLKPKYRKIAVLFFMNQKSYKEIAEILDVPMGTVFGMIHRCRAMLQTSLTAQAIHA